MEDFLWIWAWLSFMFPLAYSAGPNTILCASTGLVYGFKKTLPLIAGINTILIIYTLLTGFFMQVIMDLFPPVIQYIRIIGAAYIFWLAWQFLKPATGKNKKGQELKKAPGFWKGFIISALNPKLITALFVMFSQFLPYGNNQPRFILLLTIFTIVLSVGAHFLYTLAGNILQVFLKKHEKIQRYVFSGMLVLVGVWMLV